MQTAAANNMDAGMEDEEDIFEEQPAKRIRLYVINCTSPSTESNPIGLVVLVESSGIVGHRRRISERLPLPLSPEDEEGLSTVHVCHSPQLDRPTPLVRSGVQPFEHLVMELAESYWRNERPPAMGRAMEDMTNVTNRNMKRIPPTFRSLFIFVTSIARTNLESEIIQRGGSLCTTNPTRYKPKRDCIVPLLHVLSVHVRVLVEWPLWSSWASCGHAGGRKRSCADTHCREVIPALLADPIALLKYILIAPLHLDQVLKNTNRLSHLRRDSIASTSAAASAALSGNSGGCKEGMRCCEAVRLSFSNKKSVAQSDNLSSGL
ncbi:E3 ubiquitin-protein ligase Ubr3 [Eumeta japonica]|uniref:E3 ubiquitin-protein ligase n=1 Tax=Eumeta variegata TaxID=151549 RepID=A0A4C1SUM8_EUMVA|nr:E3 ubiquitin-protein ligase Ubr3 [Eumeta japonica]